MVHKETAGFLAVVPRRLAGERAQASLARVFRLPPHFGGMINGGGAMSAASETRRVRPKILHTMWRAWVSTGAAMRDMPLAFLMTLAAYGLVKLASSYAATLQAHAASQGGQSSAEAPSVAVTVAAVFVLCLYVLRVFALAPLAIAVHRFVLLDERSPLIPLTPAGRLLRFGGWLILLGLMNSLSSLLFPTLGPELQPSLARLAIMVVTAVVGIRLVLVFPAIAVQTRATPLSLSWSATRWQFWRIVGTLFVTFLPAGIVTWLILLLVARLGLTTTRWDTEWRVLAAIVAVFEVALGAAAASWLFVGYGLAPDTHEGVPATPE